VFERHVENAAYFHGHGNSVDHIIKLSSGDMKQGRTSPHSIELLSEIKILNPHDTNLLARQCGCSRCHYGGSIEGSDFISEVQKGFCITPGTAADIEDMSAFRHILQKGRDSIAG
jgi:hypothetical protein